MRENKLYKMNELILKLNIYRNEYYNNNNSLISDNEYDEMFEKLKELERELQVVLSNSPTQTVGYSTVSELSKVLHEIQLLSLDKTKNIEDVKGFVLRELSLFLPKVDGLTVKLEYINGELFRASTRGDGDIGEDITHNAKTFKNIPINIPYKSPLTIVGEAFIYNNDFNELKEKFRDKNGDTYKNSRNLASGSVRQLDALECSKREISFLPFKILKGFDEYEESNSKFWCLSKLEGLGFTCMPIVTSNDGLDTEDCIQDIKLCSENIPIDGIVITYDDRKFSNTLGKTTHHFNDSIAFKFEDDTFETKLNEVVWQVSRFGELSPVAVFEDVVIDGCTVTRASLHNIDFISNIKLNIGDRLLVSKRNMIIPHIEVNLDKELHETYLELPTNCPCCNSDLEYEYLEGVLKSISCINKLCNERKLQSLVHFVSKKCMNIVGLSEETLRVFMNKGFVTKPVDLYWLDGYEEEIINLDGFGKKSFDNIVRAISKSRNVKLDKFITSLDIQGVGSTASKIIAEHFNTIGSLSEALKNGYDYTILDGIGDVTSKAINEVFEKYIEVNDFAFYESIFTIIDYKNINIPTTDLNENTKSVFYGKNVLFTGKLSNFTRNEITFKLESLGAVVVSSISKNTDYLIVGEKAGSKLEKARSLGIRIISEREFMEMI